MIWFFTLLAMIMVAQSLRYRGRPWHRNAYSQGWFDAWSITHFGHGIVLFGLVQMIFVGSWNEYIAAVLLFETLWESLENRNWVINLFRSGGDKNYYGDSIANSIGDVISCFVGAVFCSFFI